MHVLACCMQAVEEQHFLVDCPFYIIREVSTFGYLAQTTNNGTLGSFSNRTPTSLVLLHTTYTCAFTPGCLMSHYWLHTSVDGVEPCYIMLLCAIKFVMCCVNKFAAFSTCQSLAVLAGSAVLTC